MQSIGWTVTQHERYPLASADRELANSSHVLTTESDWRAQHQHVRPGDCLQATTILELTDPWHGRTIVEPNHELGSETNAPALADDQAHEIRRAVARRHEIN